MICGQQRLIGVRGLVNISPSQRLWRPSSLPTEDSKSRTTRRGTQSSHGRVCAVWIVLCLARVGEIMFAATLVNLVHQVYYVSSSKYAARAVFTAKVGIESVDGIV
ncbi:unnamed protein product [Laminaria digitata]